MNRQHLDAVSNESRTFTLFARDSLNVPFNLTGQTITWNVGNRPNDPDNPTAIISKPGTIVSASAGSFTVPILSTDTTDLEGNYFHQAYGTDVNLNVTFLVQGRFRIRHDITS